MFGGVRLREHILFAAGILVLPAAPAGLAGNRESLSPNTPPSRACPCAHAKARERLAELRVKDGSYAQAKLDYQAMVSSLARARPRSCPTVQLSRRGPSRLPHTWRRPHA